MKTKVSFNFGRQSCDGDSIKFKRMDTGVEEIIQLNGNSLVHFLEKGAYIYTLDLCGSTISKLIDVPEATLDQVEAEIANRHLISEAQLKEAIENSNGTIDLVNVNTDTKKVTFKLISAKGATKADVKSDNTVTVTDVDVEREVSYTGGLEGITVYDANNTKIDYVDLMFTYSTPATVNFNIWNNHATYPVIIGPANREFIAIDNELIMLDYYYPSGEKDNITIGYTGNTELFNIVEQRYDDHMFLKFKVKDDNAVTVLKTIPDSLNMLSVDYTIKHNGEDVVKERVNVVLRNTSYKSHLASTTRSLVTDNPQVGDQVAVFDMEDGREFTHDLANNAMFDIVYEQNDDHTKWLLRIKLSQGFIDNKDNYKNILVSENITFTDKDSKEIIGIAAYSFIYREPQVVPTVKKLVFPTFNSFKLIEDLSNNNDFDNDMTFLSSSYTAFVQNAIAVVVDFEIDGGTGRRSYVSIDGYIKGEGFNTDKNFHAHVKSEIIRAVDENNTTYIIVGNELFKYGSDDGKKFISKGSIVDNISDAIKENILFKSQGQTIALYSKTTDSENTYIVDLADGTEKATGQKFTLIRSYTDDDINYEYYGITHDGDNLLVQKFTIDADLNYANVGNAISIPIADIAPDINNLNSFFEVEKTTKNLIVSIRLGSGKKHNAEYQNDGTLIVKHTEEDSKYFKLPNGSYAYQNRYDNIVVVEEV